ncbi:hypothetical protein CmeUKMEL1_09035 [Cryptosporidium meleagridis]|uniref:Uncharacterized protein n=1 Tax=Cryptosporidium meleagridis TaxID=93969 RepID=A0A2P4Z182_9CRYT|nr:hypothetical protein CmeUKMEL1_09035 [Cryptosporidium meleagridis]
MKFPRLLMNLCIAIGLFSYFIAYPDHKIELINEKYDEFSLLQMNIPQRLSGLFGRCRRVFSVGGHKANGIDFSTFDGTLPRSTSSPRRNIRGVNCPMQGSPPPLPKKPPVGDPYSIRVPALPTSHTIKRVNEST